MAVDFALDCKFPNDLESSFRELEESMSARIIDNEALLDNLQDTIVSSGIYESIGEIQEIFEGLMRQGDGDIRNFDDLAGVYGLPVYAGPVSPEVEPGLAAKEAAKREAKQLEADEKMIFDAGGIVHDGVWYLSGEESGLPSDQDNVAVLRGIYKAVGNDFDKVEAIFDAIRAQGAGANKPILFQSELIIEKIPAINNGNASVPIDEVRERFGFPEYDTGDEVIYVGANNATYVLRQNFLAQNLQKDQILKQYGVGDENLITQTFHPSKKELRPERIREVSQLGYTNAESGVIFRFKQTGFPDATIGDQIDSNVATSNTILELINFFIARVGTAELPTLAKQNLEQRIRLQIDELIKSHRKSISDLLFQVAVVRDIDILLNLRLKHTDEEIARLLEKRGEVLGINFNATTDDLIKDMDKVKNGSLSPNKKVSSNFMKRVATKPVFNQQALLHMFAELDQAVEKLNIDEPITASNLNGIGLNMVGYGAASAEAQLEGDDQVPPPIAYLGQESGKVPVVMLKVINIEDSFGLLGAFDDLDDALTFCLNSGTLGPAIAAGIKTLTNNLKQIFKQCQKLLDKAKTIFFDLLSRLDQFFDAAIGLMGAGKFDGSLLDCISLKFEFPDFLRLIISNLLCFLASLLNVIVGFSTEWIADIIQSIICFPITVLNALISKLNKFLPQCLSFNFDICPELLEILRELSAVGDTCSAGFQTASDEIGAMSLSLANLGDKVNGFGGGANCSQPANKFLSSMQLG